MAKLRFVLGASLSVLYSEGNRPATPPADPAAPAKTDPVAELVNVDDLAELVTFKVPTYDPATCNRLYEIRCYLHKSGETPGLTVEDYILNPTLKYGVADVAHVVTESTVTVKLPSGEPGAYVGRVLYGYLDETPAPIV